MRMSEAELEAIFQRLRNNDANLIRLDLSSKELTDADIFKLCEALKDNTALSTLNLSNNKIGPTGAQYLAQNKTLSTLYLYKNQIGDAGAQYLAQNKTLSTLNLDSNKISDTGAQYLSQNTTLSILDLNSNPISNTAKKQVDERLTENTTLSNSLIDACEFRNISKVKHLLTHTLPYGEYFRFKLRNKDTLLHLAVRQKNLELLGVLLPGNLDKDTKNSMDLTYTELAKQLKFTLPPIPVNNTNTFTVTTPSLQASNATAVASAKPSTTMSIREEELKTIFQRLRNNDPNLTTLNLSSKGLTDADIFKLCRALIDNTALSTLNLSNNQIGDTGAQYLSQNKTLSTLELGDNKIGPAGAQYLSQNKTLSTLILYNNQIGDVGAQYLSQNKTLSTLILYNNQIGDAGAQYLSQSTTLSTLNLYRNPISDNAKEQVEMRLIQNRALLDSLIATCQSQNISAVTLERLLTNTLPYGWYIQSKLPNKDTLLHLAVRQRNLVVLSLLLPGNLDKDTKNTMDLTYVQLAEQLKLSLPPTFGLPPLPVANINANTTIATTPTGNSPLVSSAKYKPWTPAPPSVVNNNNTNLNKKETSSQASNAPGVTSVKLSTSMSSGNKKIMSIQTQLEAIFEQLRRNDPNLTTLDLSNREITDANIFTLCEALKDNTALSRVDLSWNQIGDTGAQHLAQNKTLSTLILRHNQIGPAGAQYLSQNKTLSTLILEGNKIGDVGVQCFSQNITLSSLELGYWINNSTMKQVERRIAQNKTSSKSLILACQSKNISKVKHLLTNTLPYGEYIQSQLPNKDTLLHLAVHQKNLELLGVLLPGNLDKDTKNTMGLTYAELAEELKLSLPPIPVSSTNTTIATTPTSTSPLVSSVQNNPVNHLSNTTIITAPAKPTVTSTSQSQITVPTAPDNPLLANPALQQHLIFLSALSQENLKTLEILSKQGANLILMLPILTTFKEIQENLTRRLEAVETQTGLDAQTLAEMAYIQKNESLNRYYQTLKMLLGQTFLAAKVISSGEVDAAQGTGATVANGISNVAGALCPPAAPFLSFAATVIGVADGISSYRAAQNLSGWLDLEVMALFAKTVALQLAIAQEPYLTRSLTLQGKKTLEYIQDKCTLIVERIKSGKKLTAEESRTLLDSNELLAYMKENSKPKNASVSDCAAILLTVIMGEDYTHTSTHIIAVQQTSVTNTATTITNVTATSQSHVITREEWEAMQRKAEEAERKAEEAAKTAASAHKELETLRKKTTQSNPSSSHVVGNGPLLSVQSQETTIPMMQGAMPVSAVVQHHQTRLDDLEKAMSIMTPQWLEFQEQQRRENSSSKNNTSNDDKARNDLFENKSGYYNKNSFDMT